MARSLTETMSLSLTMLFQGDRFEISKTLHTTGSQACLSSWTECQGYSQECWRVTKHSVQVAQNIRIGANNDRQQRNRQDANNYGQQRA
jgi:hypothetical protein